MKFWQRIKKYSLIISFSAACVVILFAMAVQSFFLNGQKPEKITSGFQKVLLAKEKIIEKQLGNLENRESKKSEENRSDFYKDESALYKEKGLAFFMYENDSLTYWSTNAIPVSENLTTDSGFISGKLVKETNGWFVVFSRIQGSRACLGMILIKSRYPFENDYLHNEFQRDFRIQNEADISFDKGKNDIYTADGNYLFSLKIPEKIEYPASLIYLFFTLYLAGLILFVTFLYRLYLYFQHLFHSKWLFLLSFILDVAILRFLLLYLHIPGVLYHSFLFGPLDFSSSSILPSLGDFVVNSLLILILSYVIYLNFPVSVKKNPRTVFTKILSGISIILLIIAGLGGVLYLIRDLMMNSSIPLNLQNISEFKFSSLLGFLIIGSLFLSYFLIFIRLSGLIIPLISKEAGNTIIKSAGTQFTLTHTVFYLVVFSLIATFVLNRYNSRIEKGKRQLLALNLGSERDPAAEMKFAQMVPSLLNDKDLLFPQDTRKSAAYEDSIITELQDEYFGEYWNNYIVQITLCYGKKQLKIQPQNYLAGCEDYFRGLLLDFGKTTFSEYLYYLDYGSGYQNYLARVPIRYAENPADTAGWAYIEISSKLIFRDLGYPELLVDKKNNHLPDISGYSYAFYRSGKLIHRVGKYFYNMDLDHASMNHSLTAHFYEHDGMSHYCYPIDQNNVLLVSKKSDSFIDLMAPFSYLFFGFAMFSMLFILIVKMPVLFNISSLRLRDRLQISMTALLISSLLIIGFLIVYYIVRLNSSKNIDNLTDRTHSILVELQHKFSREDDLKKVNPEDLNQLLTKFSNVFFSDINLYSPEGRLIATSRPQIFEEGLVSSLMNYRTMSRFRVGHNSFITLEESIGDHSYYSSYIPFYNDDNQLLAYLNLPYFARQEDLKKEISTFLIAFINIYVLLIILGIFLALIVAGYISYPLRLLTSSIGKLALGTTSEKLTWRRNDEIGKLVNEYNRMTDELARNAELLARSERETAWREMARQVAHEIKNPLTPMMLSVQHLEKAWKEKASDWDQRLIRFTENMKEQIESLSTIATEFSDFAKMPQTRNEKLELNEVIGNVVSLYSNNIPVRISFECPERYYPVIADRKQILRVFTNLINNSVEAIGNKIAGEIKITLNVSEGKNIVKIMDNGSGMSQEQAKRIFQPNFTTKSGGTGLGLAIVKSIVLGAGGDISFETEEGKGTTFTVQFPLNMED